MPAKEPRTLRDLFPFSWRDLAVLTAILGCAAGLCILLRMADSIEGFASPVFVLAVLLISRFTTGYLFGLLASVLAVICVNFIFTYPYWAFNLIMTGYPITFFTFLMVSIVTCTLTSQAKQREQLRIENEKEKMRANLLRSVSHDIRTPLTSIMGAASTILENPDLEEATQREMLKDVHDEAQWLVRVVENLLSITRIGADHARIHKDLEAAEEVLEVVIRKFRRRFPQTQLSVEVPDDLLMVPMDPVLISQVLSNLLENAVVHGGTQQVRLSAKQDGDCAVFSVRDYGRGIPEKELPTLFDGTLKHNETTQGDGKRNMGLGLSVCLAIVQAHGGTMEARNTGDGAEFYFSLPLAEEEHGYADP